jgi:hypothetical protein
MPAKVLKTNRASMESFVANPTNKLIALQRWRWWHVLKEYNPAVGKGGALGSIREFWRDIRPIEGSVIIGGAVTRRCLVSQVKPGFSLTVSHVLRNLLIRRAPSQPHSVHCHTRANLTLTYQGLVSCRKLLVDFRVLRNARLRTCTTAKNQHHNSYRGCHRHARHCVVHPLR